MAVLGNIPIPAASGALGAVSTRATHLLQGGGTCVYMGITIRETAGAAAIVRIREGTINGSLAVATGGRILDTISLLANESCREWYGPQGKFCNGDLYYEKVSGAVEGSVFHG